MRCTSQWCSGLPNRVRTPGGVPVDRCEATFGICSCEVAGGVREGWVCGRWEEVGSERYLLPRQGIGRVASGSMGGRVATASRVRTPGAVRALHIQCDQVISGPSFLRSVLMRLTGESLGFGDFLPRTLCRKTPRQNPELRKPGCCTRRRWWIQGAGVLQGGSQACPAFGALPSWLPCGQQGLSVSGWGKCGAPRMSTWTAM